MGWDEEYLSLISKTCPWFSHSNLLRDLGQGEMLGEDGEWLEPRNRWREGEGNEIPIPDQREPSLAGLQLWSLLSDASAAARTLPCIGVAPRQVFEPGQVSFPSLSLFY